MVDKYLTINFGASATATADRTFFEHTSSMINKITFANFLLQIACALISACLAINARQSFFLP